MGQARPRGRWGALTAAGVVLLGGLAGCSGDEAPAPAPLEPSPASASPTEPSANPAPTLPVEAQEMTARSAERFAHYVIDVINHAAFTGETAPLREISLPGCQSCEAIVRNVRTIYRKGGRFYGKGIDLQLVSNTLDRPRDRPILDLGTYFNPEVVKLPAEKTQRRRGGKQPLTLYLRWREGGWKVQRLDVVQ